VAGPAGVFVYKEGTLAEVRGDRRSATGGGGNGCLSTRKAKKGGTDRPAPAKRKGTKGADKDSGGRKRRKGGLNVGPRVELIVTIHREPKYHKRERFV